MTIQEMIARDTESRRRHDQMMERMVDMIEFMQDNKGQGEDHTTLRYQAFLQTHPRVFTGNINPFNIDN